MKSTKVLATKTDTEGNQWVLIDLFDYMEMQEEQEKKDNEET